MASTKAEQIGLVGINEATITEVVEEVMEAGGSLHPVYEGETDSGVFLRVYEVTASEWSGFWVFADGFAYDVVETREMVEEMLGWTKRRIADLASR